MSKVFKTQNDDSYPVTLTEKPVGKGGNSEVFGTKNGYCIKKYSGPRGTGRFNDFIAELNFVRDNHNSFSLVPKFIDSGFDSDGKPFYVMKMYKPIQDLFNEERVADRLSFCIKLAKGIKELHKSGIVHRDIKPSNVALKGDCDPILLDYGTVAKEKTLTGEEADVGSDYFQAPELINPSETKTFTIDDLIKADVYSFAKTAWIIIRGDLNNVRSFSDDELYRNRKIRFRSHSSVDQLLLEPAFQMLKKGIEKDPAKRICMDDCISFLSRSLRCIEKSDYSLISRNELAEYQNMFNSINYPSSKHISNPSDICKFFGQLTYGVCFLSGNDLYEMKRISLGNESYRIQVKTCVSNPFLKQGEDVFFCPSELNIFDEQSPENRNYIKFSREGSDIEEKAFFGNEETMRAILSESGDDF